MGDAVREPLLSLAELCEKIVEVINEDEFIQSRTYDADQMSARLATAVRAVFVKQIAAAEDLQEEADALGAVKIKGAKLPKKVKPVKGKFL